VWLLVCLLLHCRVVVRLLHVPLRCCCVQLWRVGTSWVGDFVFFCFRVLLNASEAGGDWVECVDKGRTPPDHQISIVHAVHALGLVRGDALDVPAQQQQHPPDDTAWKAAAAAVLDCLFGEAYPSPNHWWFGEGRNRVCLTRVCVRALCLCVSA
jgi:hypothetical protein